MTDRRTEMRRSRRRTALTVYATAAAMFALVSGSLGLRMAQGQDPGLGALTASASHSASAHHHKGWTAKKLRTTSSGRVIPASNAGSASTPGGAATNAPTTASHEDHDA